VEAERGVLSVSGSERVSWLNAVVTSDASSVSREHAGFGLLLSKQGKIQTDFYLVADGDRLLLAVAPETTDLARTELDRMLVMEDVELGDVSSSLAALSLHGPRALELARAAAAGFGGVFGALDRTGLGGAVLVVPRQALGEVTAALEHGGARLALPGDWPAVRVAHGVGIFGIDYGPSDNPHEAGLERRAIAWQKGCYLGQEAVFMQDARGKVKRRLVVLGVEGSGEIAGGAEVERASGERVGRVTSSASVGTGERFALAMVGAPDCEPGTALVIGGSPARVVARAFEAGVGPGQTV
jgi:folate-binding protein YgfZ